MKRHTLHAVTDLVHQHSCPVIIIVRRTTTDAIQFVAGIVTQISIELAELIRVVFRSHITAATPCLVTDAEVLHLPGLVATVCPAKTSHWSITIAGHILHPLGHLLHGTRTYVTADIRLTAKHLAQVQELMCTERVILDGSSPVVVAQRRTLVLRTDTVHPVIVVGKAAARPSQHRHLQRLECFKHILSVAVNVGNL